MIQENARLSTSRDIRREVNEFAQVAWPRIRSLTKRLASDKFEFQPGKGVLSAKKDERGRRTGKFRPIVLAPLESRIIQRALLDALVEIEPLRIYFDTPFSFGGIRKMNLDDVANSADARSGVPAAIRAMLDAVKAGAQFYVCADIKAFFTRVPREAVLETIGNVVRDEDFITFLRKAVSTELNNLAELKEHSELFPIQELGVAQGNSLSPFFGNVALAKFDLEMNKGSHRCIRYIDDFVILEKTSRAANAQLRKAERLLKELNMELSPEKTSKGARLISSGLTFLGIEVLPGYVRPTSKTQQKLLAAVALEYGKSRDAMFRYGRGAPFLQTHSLLATLRRVDGMVDAWGKAYWFCSDEDLFRRIDQKITAQTRGFLGAYRTIRTRLCESRRDKLLGVSLLSEQTREPFRYPKTS